MKPSYPYLLIFMVVFICWPLNKADAQAVCPGCPGNLDFETGSFNNWTGTFGTYEFVLPTSTANPNYVYLHNSTGTPNGRFEITSGTGTDPNTGNKLPVVAPCGGKYSARIGFTGSPESQGAGNWPYSEALNYTLDVTTQNALFTYMYAAVLVDGSHDQYTQPQFEVIMKTCDNDSLLPCGQYIIWAGSGSAQFKKGVGNAQYTDWTSVATDLTGYIGKKVCITFRVRDCMGNLSSTNGNYSAASGGGHQGYAYIDTYCQPVQFVVPEFCENTASIQICAPPGYKSYSWPAGQPGLTGSPTTQCVTINNPKSGTTYIVNMVSMAGCPVSMKVPIQGIPVTKSKDTTSICPGDTVSLSALATGPNGPYSYSWSHNLGTGTKVTVNPTSNTTYSVTVTNDKKCSAVVTFTVLMKNCGPSVTVTGGTVCPGACISVNATGSGGALPYSYNWSPGGYTTAGPHTVCPTATTTYTITLKDGAGLTASATAQVAVNALPPVTASAAPICKGGTASLTASGASSYAWSAGTTPATGSSVTATPTATSTYTVTGTDLQGCTNTGGVTVTVHPLPVIAIDPLTLCKDSTGILSASGGITYSWSTGETKAGISVTPKTVGVTSYSVTGTDANGCTNTATGTVTAIDCGKPSVNITGKALCTGSCIAIKANALGGTPPLTYTWNPDLGTGAGPYQVCPTATTTYSITVTDAKGETASDTALVIVHPEPVITVNTGAVCSGQPATLTANGANTYSWSTGQTSQSIVVSPSSSTSYTVTGTSAAGCTSSATSSVTVSAIPRLNAISAAVCSGVSATLSATSDQPGTTYSWAPPTGLNSTTGDVVISNATVTTTYTITGNSNGCIGTATARITVNPMPVAGFSVSSPCLGVATQFTDASAVASGGIAGWSWDFGDGTPVSKAENPSHVYSSTGTYTVTLIVTTEAGCSDTISKPVRIYSLPVVHFGPFIKGCPLLCVDFQDSSAVADGTINQWLWNLGDGTTSTNQHPEHCYKKPGTYHVSLTVSSDKGCSASKTINNIVTVYPAPDADFSASPQPTSIFNPKIQFKDLSSGDPLSWQWTFWNNKKDSVTTSTVQHPAYKYSDTGAYQVQLVVVNKYGCRDTTIKYVVIDPEWSFYIPNTFTPNGDGINDVFIGKSWNVTEHQMWIFDRWGNMVYTTGKTRDPDSAVPWDGKVHQGVETAQIDTYVWLVILKDIFGKSHRYIGHVNLIR